MYTQPPVRSRSWAGKLDIDQVVKNILCPELSAKLIGYEGGFPPSAEGGQQSVAELTESVVSAEHIPVPKEKVQAAKDAVVLLLNGQPVHSLQRGGLTFLPVELVVGAAADSFEVVMEAPTLLYRSNAEARARKEQQIRDAAKKIADAKATLAELQQALVRSKAARKAAVEAASDPDGSAEQSDIGAMVLEKHRIKMEIAKQQATMQSQEQHLQALQRLTGDQLQLEEHRVTPRFTLQSGLNHISEKLPSAPGRPAPVRPLVQVLRAAQISKPPCVQFDSAKVVE